jgi:hypothetical protein
MTDVKSFLAIVNNVYPTNTSFLKKDKEDMVDVYNDNDNFTETDSRMYGAITYEFENSFEIEDYAFPFDKNNFTFPIKGETVVIMKMFNQTFWLPYTNTPYSNYRRDSITYKATRPVDTSGEDKSAKSYTEKTKTGGTTSTPNNKKPEIGYTIKEKVKFLKPKQGDTIISGRVGNTIRFSEFHLTEDNKTSSPSIFIRNKQNSELDSKKIGEMVDEDINKDGTSVYMTSGKVKIPFLETIKKTKIAFKDYPSSDKLKGDQLFVNSDRIILSAKASEFIIFGKGNTGIITDGNFSIDAQKEIYIHNNKNVTIHSEGSNQIFLNSENGKIFLGKDKGAGADGAPVQKMVLGGELVQILKELIDAINAQVYATPVGPTSPGPVNRVEFDMIKGKLTKLLSSTNFLSK